MQTELCMMQCCVRIATEIPDFLLLAGDRSLAPLNEDESESSKSGGSRSGRISIKDFSFFKVLGKGSFGKVGRKCPSLSPEELLIGET